MRKGISSCWGLESPPGFSLRVWAIYCTYPRRSIPATPGVGTEASLRTRESENTQSSELRFHAMLGEVTSEVKLALS